MLNRAGRFDWLQDHHQVRPSVPGRRIDRKSAASQAASATHDDEAGRSSSTNDQIRAFVDAWRTGHGAGQKEALKKIVESWRADNAAGGVPVHAHLPLPNDFAKIVARLVGEPDNSAREPTTVATVIADLDRGAQVLVARQIAGLLNREGYTSSGHNLRDRALAEERRNHEDGLVPWARDGVRHQDPQLQEHLTSLLQRVEMERARGSQDEEEPALRSFGGLLDSEVVRDAVGGLGTAGHEARDRGAWRTMEYDETRDGRITAEPLPWNGQRGQVQTLQGALNKPPTQEPPRIVRPYRRYTSPNLTPAQMAQEDRDADALARDADIHIRELIRAIEADPSFAGDRDPLVQEFLRSLKRYFAENGDRAVVSPAPGDRRASMHNKDHLAAYDPSSDRIVFSGLFKSLSREEKIITLMHELLHTTLMAKNEAVRSGYHRDRKGGMTYAKHEAWLDNLAIRLAKRLKLIPRNYPETPWRRYYEE